MNFQLTGHARAVVEERAILSEWLQITLDLPDPTEVQPDDHTVHYLKQIDAFGRRWLRVVVNPASSPVTVVTTFFDRRLR